MYVYINIDPLPFSLLLSTDVHVILSVMNDILLYV